MTTDKDSLSSIEDLVDETARISFMAGWLAGKKKRRRELTPAEKLEMTLCWNMYREVLKKERERIISEM